jgi:colanic acid biosynthesis glycosyl transferase WcaI
VRLIVHDFSGHPFQAELARSLAARGHHVLHVQCASYTSGKGSFEVDYGGNPQYASISVGAVFERYRTSKRLAHEMKYARRFNRLAAEFRPDLVLSCNDPLIAKVRFGWWAARRKVPWVFWLQDVYSVAMAREAARRSRLGSGLGAALQRLERGLLRSSDAVVAITDDFDAILDEWGVDRAKRTVIENWAPLDEVPARPRDNAWRARTGLGDRFAFLYAGTLGLKHNPDVLFDLAADDPSADVVVVSEGMGADRLRARLAEEPLPNLRILPFQPWEDLPDVLGAADVLVVLLEAEAGTFSVPSKILTSLCAGRPVLGAIPEANLGARTIARAKAGIVVAPGEPERFLSAARELRHSTDLRGRMGAAARAHAETAFDIEAITDRFLEVIARAVAEGAEVGVR